jgi:hypothetical protein
MSRIGIKLHWLVYGLICIAIVFYFTARLGQRSGPELSPVSTEGAGISSPTLNHGAKQLGRAHYIPPVRKADPAEEKHTGRPDVLPTEEKVSANQSVPVLAPIDRAGSLDPGTEYSWENPSNINRVPVKEGQYLDASSESPSSSTSGASHAGQTSISLGKYLSPATKAQGLVIIIDAETGNTRSNVGDYLDPEAESPETTGADPTAQRNVGIFLDAYI